MQLNRQKKYDKCGWGALDFETFQDNDRSERGLGN